METIIYSTEFFIFQNTSASLTSPYHISMDPQFIFDRQGALSTGADQDASECYWIEIQPTISKAIREYSNACILSTKALSIVVCSSFRGNIPSSLFNTVKTANSTDCSTSVAAILVVYNNTKRSSSVSVIVSNNKIFDTNT